ncbi:hypothetical protein N8915_00395 [Flavobacteriaceae bacterium]|nr:hypothetical protein [Flavobacteriaceae bacterium]
MEQNKIWALFLAVALLIGVFFFIKNMKEKEKENLKSRKKKNDQDYESLDSSEEGNKDSITTEDLLSDVILNIDLRVKDNRYWAQEYVPNFINKQTNKKADEIPKFYNELKIDKKKARFNVKELKLDKGILLIEGLPFNGVAENITDDGRLKSETEYVDGKKNGFNIDYNTMDVSYIYDEEKDDLSDQITNHNLKIKMIKAFKNNMLEGMLEQYWANGKLRHQINYKENRKDGIERIFHTRGQLECVFNNSKGMEEGESLFFRENGTLDTVANWKNGMKNGISETYYENGKIMAVGEFSDDKRMRDLVFSEDGNFEKLIDRRDEMLKFQDTQKEFYHKKLRVDSDGSVW